MDSFAPPTGHISPLDGRCGRTLSPSYTPSPNSTPAAASDTVRTTPLFIATVVDLDKVAAEPAKPVDLSGSFRDTFPPVNTSLSGRAPSTAESSVNPTSTSAKLTLPSFHEIFPSPTRPERPGVPSSPINSLGPVAEYCLPLRVSTGEIVTMPFTIQKPDNEGVYSATRKTVSGKTITYTLSVKQQPERARACGAGARACADRRPVDPPPVVELRIFEGENTKTDVTLSYNASFFLFATLELARPIANGRMHMPHILPVLTGCPVAGANYLDRPAPAAYFLFPDLSVRHEGWYRLSFNLYEAAKDKDDLDTDPPITTSRNETQPADMPMMLENMAWRLEVKSTPFQVYSAKKFPGLSESTEISRIVADQGCRVRIRRDIRMRKRVNGKDEYDAYDEGMPSADRYATPDSSYPPPTPTDGIRSASRCSVDTTHLSNDLFRRYSQSESGFSANPHGRRALPAPLNIQPTLPAPNASRPSSSHSLAMSLPIGHSADRLYPDQTSSRPQLPHPTAMPHNIAPEIDSRRESVQLPALIMNSSTPRQPAQYDSGRRQWAMPDILTSAKRSLSPRSDPTHDPLKQGMRPDMTRDMGSYTNGSIEADSDPYSSYDNEPYVNLGHFMEYRRACGRASRKAIPKLGL